MRVLRRSVLFSGLAGLSLLAACQNSTSDGAESLPIKAEIQAPATIFLVRHAEKTKDKDNPDLTEAGQARAALLASFLKDAKIERIHSSNYNRTLQTAAPLASTLGLEVELYDPRDLPSMAAALKAAGGRHLVVGHSNTTPPLTALLGGEAGTPIVEATEYNRLYLVSIDSSGQATSTLLRFGESNGH